MHKKTLSTALGSAVVASLTLAPIVNAAENPFAMQAIAGSQQLAEAGDKTKEGKCGEGFRDRDDEVRLIEVSARLIELLQEGCWTGREALLQLAAGMHYPDLLKFIPFGEQTLNQLRDWGAVVGRRTPLNPSIAVEPNMNDTRLARAPAASGNSSCPTHSGEFSYRPHS